MDTTLTIIMLTLKRLGTVQIYVSVKIQKDKKTASKADESYNYPYFWWSLWENGNL